MQNNSTKLTMVEINIYKVCKFKIKTTKEVNFFFFKLSF